MLKPHNDSLLAVDENMGGAPSIQPPSFLCMISYQYFHFSSNPNVFKQANKTRGTKENKAPLPPTHTQGQGTFCFWDETAWPHLLGELGSHLKPSWIPVLVYEMPMIILDLRHKVVLRIKWDSKCNAPSTEASQTKHTKK